MVLSKLEAFARYEIFIVVGFIMITGAAVKLARYYDFSSDWFWLIAGIGLMIEGAISLLKQRKFDRKYKIIERES